MFVQLKDLEGQIGALQLLAYLAKVKKTYISDIMENINLIYETTYNALKKLKQLELIYDKPESAGFGKPKRWIYLTEKGKKVAEKLIEVEKILKEK